MANNFVTSFSKGILKINVWQVREYMNRNI